MSSPESVAPNRAAAADGDSASLQTIPKSLQSAHPAAGEKDPFAAWQAKPEEPGYETSKDKGFVKDIFEEEPTPEELREIEEISGQEPSSGAQEVDEADSGAESDFDPEADADATTTGPTRAESGGPAESVDGTEATGGADDPEDPTQAGANAASGGSSPVQATPGQKLTSQINLDVLQHLFRGRADAADLVKLVLGTPSTAAKTNILNFAVLLRVAEEKASDDISLSQPEKDAALAELDALVKDYIALVKADGLGKKSAFGVFYTGRYQHSKKIQELGRKLGELSGSRTAEGCQALRTQMLALYIDSFLRDFVEQKYGGNVDATAEQLRDLVDYQAQMALQKVTEACQEIAKNNPKSIFGAAKILTLLTILPDLLRGDEDENAAKAAQAKTAAKKAPLADPNALPSPTGGPGANPAANPASGTTNIFNGPFHFGDVNNIENSFNNSTIDHAEGGDVHGGEAAVGDLTDFGDEDDASSSTGYTLGSGNESIGHGFDEVVASPKAKALEEQPIAPVPLPRSARRYDPVELNVSKPEVGGSGLEPSMGPVTIKRENVEVAPVAPASVQAFATEPESGKEPTRAERLAAYLKRAREQNPTPWLLPKTGRHLTSYLEKYDPVELTVNRKDRKQITGKAQPHWLTPFL